MDLDYSEQNKTIAEFMGIQVMTGYNEHNNNRKYYYYNNSIIQDYVGLPMYEEDWNDLIPVITKIAKIASSNPELGFKASELIRDIQIKMYLNHINAAYKMVVTFILWYNEAVEALSKVKELSTNTDVKMKREYVNNYEYRLEILEDNSGSFTYSPQYKKKGCKDWGNLDECGKECEPMNKYRYDSKKVAETGIQLHYLYHKNNWLKEPMNMTFEDIKPEDI